MKGFVVLDMSQFLSAPFATLRHGDLGARVIKIERPDAGDLCRRLYLQHRDRRGCNRSISGPPRVLSRELNLAPRNLEVLVRAQAAVAARHVRSASSRRTRSVRREVRWRWTLNVLWTAA